MGLLLLQGASDLNPRELFANGEQGLWLDPSQMSTLYQDSNGVTPCTAAGDPVGLILDQSRGGLGALGAELVANGGFDSWSGDNPTGWTIEGTENATNYVTESSGRARVVSDGSTMGISQTILTVGKWYAWSADVISVTGTCKFVFGTADTLFTTPGKKSGIVNANGTKFQVRREFACDAVVDNISIREIPGNHAYQTTSASRPTLARIPVSGRRNLLTRTEEFDNAAWTLTQATISANATTAPDNTSTADKLISSAATAARSIRSTSTFSAGTLVCSVYVKAAEYSKFGFREGNTTGAYATFNLATGAVVSQGDGGTGSITSIGNGWYRCSCAFTSAGSVRLDFHPLPDSYTSGRPDISFAGDGTSGVFLWGAQLETGSTVTNYQKVVATTDVTESGFADLYHLSFDGSDDSLVTNSVDFTGTDEMTVIAGVRKLSDAARGTVCELTATIASNNGAFHLTAPNAASATYAFESKGTLLTDGVASSVTAPLTSVISGSADISGDSNVIRVNGTQSDSDTGDQGIGNYSNAVIYIGRRGGSSLPYNGHLYQLIIRGKTTPTGKLLEAERFVGRKTGVTGI